MAYIGKTEPVPLAVMFFNGMIQFEQAWCRATLGPFVPNYFQIGPVDLSHV